MPLPGVIRGALLHPQAPQCSLDSRQQKTSRGLSFVRPMRDLLNRILCSPLDVPIRVIEETSERIDRPCIPDLRQDVRRAFPNIVVRINERGYDPHP